MDGKTLRYTLGIAALSTILWLVLLWQPARQVRLHQRHLLRAVEKRNWPKVGGFLAAEYRDRWEHDKAGVLQDAQLVFGQFFFCKIESEERNLDLQGDHATISQRLTVSGSGSPVAEMVKQRVSQLTEPFTFRWQRRSWKPWDWQLLEADQPKLEIDASL